VKDRSEAGSTGQNRTSAGDEQSTSVPDTMVTSRLTAPQSEAAGWSRANRSPEGRHQNQEAADATRPVIAVPTPGLRSQGPSGALFSVRARSGFNPFPRGP
jgi:hypothetical protein